MLGNGMKIIYLVQNRKDSKTYRSLRLLCGGDILGKFSHDSQEASNLIGTGDNGMVLALEIRGDQLTINREATDHFGLKKYKTKVWIVE